LDRAETWEVVDKVKKEKKVDIQSKKTSRWEYQYVQSSTCSIRINLIPLFDFNKTYTPIICFDSLQLLLAFIVV
jgi:hypothetical protein